MTFNTFRGDLFLASRNLKIEIMKLKLLFLILILFAAISSFSQIDEQGLDGTKQFGNAVATDGDWAVVGNMWQTGQRMGHDYPNAGMISIYKILPNGNWELLHNIDEPSYFAYDNNPASPIGLYFGCSVDISGNNIIVGAYAYDSDMEGDIGPDGMAFIYSYDAGSNIFVKTATLAPEVAVENEFGWSVAISDTWAVVGDPTDRHALPAGGDDRENIGSAHIYKLEAGNWNYHKKLTASNGWGAEGGGAVGTGDNFGYSVDVDGDKIIVGAPNKGIENNHPVGAAYIYEWQGGNNWNETFLQAMIKVDYSYFGKKVAINSDYGLVGAPDQNTNGTAHLFAKNAGNWGVGFQVSASDATNGNRFGSNISLNEDLLVIGSYGFNSSSGKVYLYEYKNAYAETTLQSSNIAIGDEYGIACDISSDHLIIGAHKTERNANIPGKEGTAYMYSLAQAFGGDWTGAVSTDWGDPNNWADINVPNGATDVVINALAANQPLIDNMQANCKNLSVEAGATISISADAVLNVNGNLNNAGQIVNVAKSNRVDPSVIVLGETVFNGAGRQDVPSGIYQAFTFQAQEDSYLTGNVTFNGNYDHDTFDDLEVGANTLTLGGLLFGHDNHLEFTAQSSLIIINDRVIDLYLSSGINNLYDLTINVPGNHHVAFAGSIEVHNQLNLLDGNLYLGFNHLSGILELHNPIHIVDGQLLPHKLDGDSELYIYNANKSKDVFHIPSSLSTLDMLYIDRTNATVLDGDLHIESIFFLASDGFSPNGHQITYGEDGELWIYNDAEITADMVSGPNGIENVIINSGSPTLDFDGEIQGDFQIAANAGQVDIAAGRCITVNGTTSIGANLILRSDATGSACFIDNGPVNYSSKADANIIVEAYIPSKEEWHYIASPVENATAEFFAGAFLNAYNPDDELWVPFTSLSQNLNTMQGYSSKLPAAFSGQKIEFTGELNTAQSSALNISLSDGGDAYNLVGNPFPSPIDWDDANWTKTNLANAIYIWNPQTGSYTSYVNGAGVNGGTQYIPSMQGFFVEATGINPSLQIDNNDVRKVNEAVFLKSEDDIENQMRIHLFSGNESDEAIIRFMEGASEHFDDSFDARKLFGRNSLAQVFVKSQSDEDLAIQTLNTIKETDLVFLGLKIEEAGEYELFFDLQSSFSEFVSITLEDKTTNDFTSLGNETTYSFYHDPVLMNDRFVLHFKDVTGLEEAMDENMSIYHSQNQIYIDNTSEEHFQSILIYSMAGQVIMSQNLSQESVQSISSASLSKGTYLVHLVSQEKSIRRKIIIQ